MPVAPAYRPDPAFAALGPEFSDPVEAAYFPAPKIRIRDERAAARVGLDTLSDQEWLKHFGYFQPLPGQPERPLAMRYHGHQFRTYNPDIGDGRGFLFAQLRDTGGRLMDLGTKGSGQTPYSRFGDGRMTLQGGVREAIAARFLEAVGVSGCAILSLVETGEELERGDEPAPIPGAVLTRLQHSHVRIGTFQRHATIGEPDAVRALVEHAVAAYYPELVGAPVAEFLRAVVEANATLAAGWMAAGYVHGVLNSDNMTVTGESFDYGPWRALPVYEPGFTAAYFDHSGLYAYGRQPEATLWNLTRLAECLTLIAAPDPLAEALGGFEAAYQTALGVQLCARFGVESLGRERDIELVRAWATFMHTRRPAFEGVFFDWFGGAPGEAKAMAGPRARRYRGPEFTRFASLLKDRAPVRPERMARPYFDGDEPTTVTIDVARAAWEPIWLDQDWSALTALLKKIERMREALALSTP